MVAPYLAMADMPTSSALPQHWAMREFGSGMRFINGDVLVARITPCLENGKTAFVSFLNDEEVGWGSTEYIVFRSKAPLPLEYAYFLARIPEFRSHAIANMTGTSGRQRVPRDCFDHYPVIVPSEPVAACFGEMAGNFIAMMKHNDEESRTLAELRDTLLPKLISGQLRVPEAKELAEESL
jgi:type I restriction enzyme S subunit